MYVTWLVETVTFEAVVVELCVAAVLFVLAAWVVVLLVVVVVLGVPVTLRV